MTINTIDTTTPLVGLKAGAEVYNANFTDTDNAASREVGTLPDNVPDNQSLPAFGTAAEANTGTGAGDVPTNSDLGSASTKNAGTGVGDVPTNGDLGTASLIDKQTSSADTAAGKAIVTDSLGINGGPIFDSSNYQPDAFDGLGSKTRLYNLSGSGVVANAIVSGSVLRSIQCDDQGVVSTITSMSGSYKNVSGGTVLNGRHSDFTKVSD